MKHLTLFLLFFAMFMSSQEHVYAQKGIEINHIALSVINLKRSFRFYSEVIGLDSIPEPFKDGRHAWFSIGKNISLHLIEDAPAEKTYYKNSHLCFSSDNLALFIQKLKKEGLSFEDVKGTQGVVTTRVDGVQQIYFRDPDGYWIEMNDAKK